MVSLWGTTAMEEVAQAAPDCVKMLQFYFSKIEDVNLDLYRRAVAAGYVAACLTIDANAHGKREDDIRNNFQLPRGLQLANF